MSTQASQTVFPEVGDLVVATVTRVEDYGAYVKLDEYAGIEGLVHISEISTTWVSQSTAEPNRSVSATSDRQGKIGEDARVEEGEESRSDSQERRRKNAEA